MKKNILLSKKIADASKHNWVDQFCPSWSKPYLKLSRVDRPIGSWLLLLPCWWGSALAILSYKPTISFQDYWIILGCVFGSILMRGAGCTWNDINDKNFDSQVVRTQLRPLPSGQVSTKQAFIWMFFQLVLALFILLTFNKFAILIGLISILPVIIYPYAKRFTWWPQLFLGVCFNWGILLSFAAHSNSLNTSTVIFYVAGIFWTLFYDTIYAFQDTEDDALIGIKSTALLFGKTAKYWLLVFAFCTFLLMNISINLIPTLSSFSRLLLISGVTGFCLHLFWQVWTFKINDSDLCLKLFQSNKIAGLIIVTFSILAIMFR